MGAEGNCEAGEVSSQGKVGLHVIFPVEDATYDQMQLHYGMRQGGVPMWCGSEPVIVTRTSPSTWTIEGTTACLKDGGVQGDYIDQGDIDYRDAPFLLKLTQIL